jgi:hypothetical protein
VDVQLLDNYKKIKKMGLILISSLIILMVIIDTIRLNRRERMEKEQEEEFRKQQAMKTIMPEGKHAIRYHGRRSRIKNGMTGKNIPLCYNGNCCKLCNGSMWFVRIPYIPLDKKHYADFAYCKAEAYVPKRNTWLTASI